MKSAVISAADVHTRTNPDIFREVKSGNIGTGILGAGNGCQLSAQYLITYSYRVIYLYFHAVII